MFRRREERRARLHEHEQELDEVTHRLELTAAVVQKKVEGLEKVANRLETLKEALDERTYQ